jgi:hypothetical protein
MAILSKLFISYPFLYPLLFFDQYHQKYYNIYSIHD